MTVDLKSQVEAYGQQLLEDQAPLSSAEVLAPVRQIREIPPTPIRDRRVRSRRNPWALAGALAIVGLLIGSVAFWARSDTEPADPSPVTSVPPPTAVTTIPSDPESATTIPVETDSATPTPLPSPFTWVRLSGDQDQETLPGWYCINDSGGAVGCGPANGLPWPSGFAMFQSSHRARPFGPLENAARLWVSPDGIDWHIEPLPEGADGLSFDNGTYWLGSESPARLWRSTDGVTWDELDADGLVPPDLVGVVLNGGYSPPVTVGDLTLSYAIFETREELLAQWLLIIGEDQATPVEVPWPLGFNRVTLFGGDDWIDAYVEPPGSGPVTVWRTSDGRSWTELGTLVLPDGTASTYVDAVPGLLVAGEFGLHDWESTDGVTWSPRPDGLPADTYPIRLESGWFANDGSIGGRSDGDAWWVHVGGTWVSLAELGMETPGPTVGGQSGCVVSATAVGQTTFFQGTGSCRPSGSDARDLWVLNLNP